MENKVADVCVIGGGQLASGLPVVVPAIILDVARVYILSILFFIHQMQRCGSYASTVTKRYHSTRFIYALLHASSVCLRERKREAAAAGCK